MGLYKFAPKKLCFLIWGNGGSAGEGDSGGGGEDEGGDDGGYDGSSDSGGGGSEHNRRWSAFSSVSFTPETLSLMFLNVMLLCKIRT